MQRGLGSCHELQAGPATPRCPSTQIGAQAAPLGILCWAPAPLCLFLSGLKPPQAALGSGGAKTYPPPASLSIDKQSLFFRAQGPLCGADQGRINSSFLQTGNTDPRGAPWRPPGGRDRVPLSCEQA